MPCIITLILNTFDNSFSSPLPKAKAIKRWSSCRSDPHWADTAVLSLIDDVFSAIHHCPVVVLATARPALLDQWTPRHGRHNSLTLHLDPLGRDATGELLEHLVGAPVPDAVASALFERSGGNPFFLEELVSLLDGEAVAEPGRAAALPDTLRALVAARLDDLTADQRAVLQDASVIGQRGPMMGLREMGRQSIRASTSTPPSPPSWPTRSWSSTASCGRSAPISSGVWRTRPSPRQSGPSATWATGIRAYRSEMGRELHTQ